MMKNSKLTYEEIVSLAVNAGAIEWSFFLKEGQALLQSKCLNHGRAWMFFRNPEIEIPKNASLRKSALVLSDKGEVRTTADFQPDFNACMDYLKTMSDHFEERDL